jgi:hypothetical protein
MIVTVKNQPGEAPGRVFIRPCHNKIHTTQMQSVRAQEKKKKSVTN